MSSSSSSDAFFGLLGVLGFLSLLLYAPFWFFDIAPFSDTKIVFAQVCDSGNEETCRWTNRDLRKYKVDVSSQTVIQFGKSFDVLETQSNCVVVDRNNWKCAVTAFSGVHGFINGEFVSPSEDYFRSTNKINWWFNEILTN